MTIKENLNKLKLTLPETVQLVAVSKTKPLTDIMQAYESGIRDFGENKIQELIQKQPELPQDIRWHFIGHVQTNKIKFMASFVHMIHGVDREKVLKEINKQAVKNNRVIDVLLQFHIAREETKYGFSLEEAKMMLEQDILSKYPNVRISGVMGMATFTTDKEQVRTEFRMLRQYFEQLKLDYFSDYKYFKEISMGMTNDYPIAIEEGATMVRLGSIIFGPRNKG
jgi:hypothetical protein